MNITHAKLEEVQGDKLQAIFNRQKDLFDKYHIIEQRQGFKVPDLPINLDDKFAQNHIKNMAWRIIEELGEALDAKDHDELHFLEEIIDGLHFFTELTIIAGLDYYQLTTKKDGQDYLEALFEDAERLDTALTLAGSISLFITELGMACNTLKNKPWKQTFMKTDKEEFRRRIRRSWVAYVAILIKAGLNPEETTGIYLKKSQVNIFRQRSNY